MTLQRTAPATPDVPATPIGSNTQIVDTLDGGHEIADGLSRLLADTYTLYLKTHNYHWNVTGPMFAAVEMEHDEPTADILTQRIQAHEKSAWMLRSLLA